MSDGGSSDARPFGGQLADGARERELADRLLVARIAAGGADGQDALATLFLRYRRPLLAAARARGVAAAAAEDAVQDLFIRVAENASAARSDGHVSAWLFTILRNLLIDQWRKGERELELSEEAWQGLEQSLVDPAPQPPEALRRESLKACLALHWAQFARQHPLMAEALYRTVDLGWTDKQLADHLERSHAATRQFLAKCRRFLGVALAPCAALRDGG